MIPWNNGTALSKVHALDETARVARALGHGSRLLLLERLAQTSRSVGDLAHLAGLKLSTTSAHLHILREAQLVVSHREGATVVYGLAGPHIAGVLCTLYDLVAPVGPVQLAEQEEVLLDVRPVEEFEGGHLPGAVNIPLDELARRLAEFPTDARYLAYCRGRFCTLSHEAAAILRDHGVPVRVSEIGVVEWLAADALVLT